MTISRLMRLLNCLLICWASSLLMDGSHSEELSPNLLFLGSWTTLAFHQSSEEWFDWFLFLCICSKGCNSRQIKDLKHQFCTGVWVTSLPFKLGIEKPSRNGWKCLIPYLFISRMDSILMLFVFCTFSYAIITWTILPLTFIIRTKSQKKCRRFSKMSM